MPLWITGRQDTLRLLCDGGGEAAVAQLRVFFAALTTRIREDRPLGAMLEPETRS